MNNLLVWPLTDTGKIVFVSKKASLSSITCCDSIDIQLEMEQQSYTLISSLTGCQLTLLKELLQQIITETIKKAEFKNVIFFLKPERGPILLELHKDDSILSCFLLDTSMIQAWIAQLDLLQVVIEENENEKKIGSKGCC